MSASSAERSNLVSLLAAEIDLAKSSPKSPIAGISSLAAPGPTEVLVGFRIYSYVNFAHSLSSHLVRGVRVI